MHVHVSKTNNAYGMEMLKHFVGYNNIYGMEGKANLDLREGFG